MGLEPVETDACILEEINFGFLGSYRVAGMGEPILGKMVRTHKLLRELGIGAILTLTEDDLYGSRHRKAGFFHHHEPIDDAQPPTAAGMDRALAFIEASLPVGVAVQCMEGRGRTGTVLCAWLARQESLETEQAIRRIHELCRRTVLTPPQRMFLRSYLSADAVFSKK
jgi:atypical dual specificity phosphatase